MVQGVHGAGKMRLASDIVRQANTGEVTELRREARGLKEMVAEQKAGTAVAKKSMLGDGDVDGISSGSLFRKGGL
jgi:transposase